MPIPEKYNMCRCLAICTARTRRTCQIVPALIRTRLLCSNPRVEIDILPSRTWAELCRVAVEILHSEFQQDAARLSQYSGLRASDVHDMAAECFQDKEAQQEFYGMLAVLLERAPRCGSVYAVGLAVPRLLQHCFHDEAIIHLGAEIPFAENRYVQTFSGFSRMS